ncbi:MAG: DNA-binding protein [Scytonematopsis contorta HA4267-MV1]|jgi:hypothetical protein|nr:DNA-binding protein [Scytonematopsis contorta HA4267-MV1]
MFVGTTEAACLLCISCQRIRQLLKDGRIRGAKKVGRFWQIPLFSGIPQIIEGTRGPQGNWRKRLQCSPTKIHVNRHKFDSNQRQKENEPMLVVHKGKKSQYCHEVEIFGPCKLVYRPHSPLNSGAKLWIEVDQEIQITTKTFA